MCLQNTESTEAIQTGWLWITMENIYRGFHEERSILWRGDTIGHCEKNGHKNMCLILNGHLTVWISRPNSVRFLFVGLKSEVCERKVDTRDELQACLSDAAASIKKREDQLRRRTRDLRTRFAKCIEVDGWDFRKFIVCCKKFVNSV